MSTVTTPYATELHDAFDAACASVERAFADAGRRTVRIINGLHTHSYEPMWVLEDRGEMVDWHSTRRSGGRWCTTALGEDHPVRAGDVRPGDEFSFSTDDFDDAPKVIEQYYVGRFEPVVDWSDPVSGSRLTILAELPA